MNVSVVVLIAVVILAFVVIDRLGLLSSTPSKELMSRNISDEEFLAAVPDTDPKMALRVRAMISEQLDVPVRCIHPNDRLIEDLHANW